MHFGFNLYWPSRTENNKYIQVLMAVEKDIINRIIINNQSDFVSHPYCLTLDIKKLEPLIRKSLKNTIVVNLYDKKINKS